MKQVVAPVISNSELAPDTHLIWLECPGIAAEARPGQFIMVRCGEDTLLPRPLSIHQRDGNRIALLLAVVGKGTAWLSQREVGDKVDIFGPLGNGFSFRRNSNNLLLVAGGMGLAPLRFLAEEASKKGYSVTMVYGTADKKRYPRRLLPGGIRVVAATEDGTVGYRGLATDLIPKYIDWADQIFACGPVPMYETMARMTELREKPVQVSLEVVMGCGHGVCYGCTIRTKKGLKQVCKDGPVFDLDEIIWDKLES